MFESIHHLITTNQLSAHTNQNILVCSTTHQQGLDLAKQILYKECDRKTSLFLSGGRTPKELYSVVSKEEVLDVGFVGMVDERYGKKFHKDSNETMMRDVGLLRYFQMRDIPFYLMLQHEMTREQTAENYDEQLRSLFATYQKSIGVLGIGLDGHTAGLPALSSKFKNQNSKLNDGFSLVAEYNDEGGFYKERVTMTFLGLSMMELLIVLVFGDDKKKALQLMFEDGSEEEIPSRFFKREDIAKKTLLITDQQV